jgi:oxygen-dependent protoporphyrinogen oxidase
MGALVDALVDDIAGRGVELLAAPATGLEQVGRGWLVRRGDGPPLTADAVVLATPAHVAATLIEPHAGGAAELLHSIPYASVALISLAVPRQAVDRELDASGFLVPRAERRTVTACSWTSAKWPHLAPEGTVWLRASVGRDGADAALALPDRELIAAVLADLAEMMALHGAPTDTRVTRWPISFPQYRPGHLDRVASIESELEQLTAPLVVAGAAMRGLGVPACIRQGRAAARAVVERDHPHAF